MDAQRFRRDADERMHRAGLVGQVLELLESEARRGQETPACWRWLDREMAKHVYQGA